ncbi:hypothetical protein [Ottowia sp.]|uniref:hypothetical protein n=1 Tax=Ottowia sp. TaxID=1898956 RepID=UPI0025D15771|nr:hypothetical protein [Ottowia sp.]MBK6616522.1 hypothetical protein [Ottowia sp.]
MKSEPSYWLAFLNHPYNIGLMTGMFGAGVLASYPFGMDGLILTFLAFLAVEVIGLATVPALPSFRAAVNKEAERREVRETSARLLAEINQHGGSPHVRSYERMASRVESLYRIAADASTALSERDVAQLETLTLDYLRQCLSDSVLKGQDDEGVADSLKRQIRGLDQRIERGGLDADEKAQLTRARAEFEEALGRQGRMASRRSALDAALVSIPLRMEEVYQMVLTAPSSRDLSQLLEESMSKLRIAEQVQSMDVDALLAADQRERSAVVTPLPVGQAQRRASGTRE